MTVNLEEVKAIFLAAVEDHTSGEWGQYLDAACAGNLELRQQVESLLEAHTNRESILDKGAIAIDSADYSITEKPGTVIDRYKLMEQIGEGGMGVVYVAEQAEPVRRRVALKIIKPGMDSKQVIARFEAERQALALMDHPNVAKVLDAGSTDLGRPYFVMDLVRGLPITEYCDKQKLNPRARLDLFVTVCEAIQHAHRKGIIHRDIKPNNVLVTRNGERAVPKVIDFGVAKAIKQRLTERTIYTQFNQLIGTPLYMSPEQAEMSELDVDTRSDVYSLGVLLYELLTGSTPFDQEKLSSVGYDELRRIVKEEEPPRPSDRVSTLSAERLSTVSAQRSSDPLKLRHVIRGELDWIVMKALEKDRVRRYDSANALAADVQRFLAGDAVEACPPSVGYRFKKFAHRNRIALTTGGVVILAMVLGIIGTSWQAWRATRALANAEANLQLAGEERQRAEDNLQLAMQAVDEAYLASIEDRLMAITIETLGWDWAAQEPAPTTFTQQEQDLMRRGLRFYDQIAGQNPSSQQAQFQAALAYSKTGLLRTGLDENEQAQQAYDDAISRFRRLCDQDPTRPEYFVELARAHFRRSYLNEWARDALEETVNAASRAIELTPDDIDAHRLRGMAYEELRHYENALPDFQKVVDLAPDAAASHFNLSELLAYLNENDQGLEHAQRAVELAPDIARYWNRRGFVATRLNRWEEALSDFTRASELAPQRVPFWQNRCFALRMLGRWDEALEGHEEAIARFPDSAEAFAGLAQLLVVWKREPDRAVRMARKAVELASDNAVNSVILGMALYRQGDYEQAIPPLEKSLELGFAAEAAPYELDAHLFLAMAHWQLGREEIARASFERAASGIAQRPDNEVLQRYLVEAEELINLSDTHETAEEAQRQFRCHSEAEPPATRRISERVSRGSNIVRRFCAAPGILQSRAPSG